MSEPNSEEPHVEVDSVSEMHRDHMTQMNDPVMLTGRRGRGGTRRR